MENFGPDPGFEDMYVCMYERRGRRAYSYWGKCGGDVEVKKQEQRLTGNDKHPWREDQEEAAYLVWIAATREKWTRNWKK